MSNSKKTIIRIETAHDSHLPYYRLFAGGVLVDDSFMIDSLILQAFALFVSDESYMLDNTLDNIFGSVLFTLVQKRREVFGKNVFHT